MKKITLEEDFIPNFLFLSNGGEISNYKSKIVQIGDFSYVSVNNSVNVFNSLSEVSKSYYNRKNRVSYFTVEDKLLIIGYKNGVIEVINEENNEIFKYKTHKKQINYLKKVNNYVLSACADGTIALYDLVLETVKIKYKGNNFCIDACVCDGSLIVAGCSDSTLKIWNIESEDLKDTIVFDRRMRDIFICDSFLIVFFVDCDTIIIDLKSKETQKWMKFKKIRSIKFGKNILSILTNKKLTNFEIKAKDKLRCVELDSEKTESSFVDFDFVRDTKIFLSSENSLIYKTPDYSHSLSFHKQNIINVVADKNENICSFSTDKLIIWYLDEDKLKISSFITVMEGVAFCCFRDFYVVGTKTNLLIYNINTRDLIISKEISVTALDASENTLVVGTKTEILFLNENLETYDQLDVEEPVTYLKLIDKINLLLVAKLNSKVYGYELPTLDRKLVLYGHSLPVKHISVSPNYKNIITTGADKVIKIWGLQFGECLKTIVNDTENTEYINNELFVVGTSKLKYYKKFEVIKEYNYKSNYVKLIGEYLFSALENSILVLKMDKYELNLDESSEESDEELQRETEIINTHNYDEFLTLVEKLEEKSGESIYKNTVERFYSFIDKLSLSEIDSYLILLTPNNIDIILDILLIYVDRNVLLISRILMTLVSQHKDIVTANKNFKSIVEKCREDLKDARELFGLNMVSLKLLNEDNCFELN